jgi:GTPase SAR1 family protein
MRIIIIGLDNAGKTTILCKYFIKIWNTKIIFVYKKVLNK